MHAIFLIGAVAMLLAALLLSHNGQSRVDLPWLNVPLPALCNMKRLTGLECPGCGLTRCFISLAHGDVAAAWQLNPAGLLVFALVAAQIPYRAAQIWRLRRGLPEFTHRRLSSVLTALLVAALLIQWAWKMFQLVALR
jgi:hypothetical protein